MNRRAGPGRLLCFYDYDTQWGADRSRSAGGPKSWGSLDFENTEKLLDLHARYDVPACFAVVASAALDGARPYHDPGQIRRIHAAGHEIASHGLVHEWLPGLGRDGLRQTLLLSKQVLEDCLGAEVVSFVPPFNQPFDYPRGLSISLAERREAGALRTNLPGLCRALRQTGFLFCRIVYRSVFRRAAEGLLRRRLDHPVGIETIQGVRCLRLNSPVGFGPATLRLVERCAAAGGYVVVYAHPHSLSLDGPQNVRFLAPFLERVARLRSEGRLRILLPGQLEETPGDVETCRPLLTP